MIRTAVVTRGRAYLHVGGAIVADSDPAEEYEESLVKARTVAGALGATLNPSRALHAGVRSTLGASQGQTPTVQPV